MNVVISVAALTGVPLYLPVIWSMFSKRQTGKTLLSVTFISLAINLFFKFVSPALLDFTLSRGQEMMLGALCPIVLLSIMEIALKIKGYEREKVDVTKSVEISETSAKDGENTNKYTNRILGLSIMAAAAVVCVLGSISPSDRLVPVLVGAVTWIIGIVIYRKSR